MLIQRRWNFGLGTVFSLIVVYFIFLYSRDKGWTFLAFISRWYLIIVGGLILLSIGALLLIIILSLVMLFASVFKIHAFSKRRKEKRKEKNHKDYIEAEYKVKE